MKIWLRITVLFVMILAAGCGGEDAKQQGGELESQQTEGNQNVPEEEAPERVIDTTPVVLDFAVHLPINEEFEQLYIEPVKQKYPHITLEYNRINNFSLYDQIIAAGEIPDFYISFNGNMPGLRDRGINMDMEELFKKHNFDLSRFQQNYLDDIQYAAVKEGELYGLPLETAFHALYYNIDLFDNFGVAHPEDGMTMEEAYEIAREMTRVEDGVQYRGWDIGSIARLAQPLGLEFVSHETEKAIMSSEGWKRVFELGKRIYSIPGNEPASDSSKNRVNGFLGDRSIAMLNETNIFSRLKEAEEEGLNWDVVQHPYYEERPNIYGNSTVYMVGAVPTTKHMDQVMLVIEVLTSDEVQMEISKAGRVSPLDNEEIRLAFGQGDPLLKDKNLPGILKGTPVQYPIYLYRNTAQSLMSKKFNEYVNGVGDVNTLLRELDDEINLEIEAEKKEN